jgi:hypothetical protein
MYLQNIVKDIKSGKLTRDTDEKGASGFWDYAGEYSDAIDSNALAESTQEQLYNDFWSIIELTQDNRI